MTTRPRRAEPPLRWLRPPRWVGVSAEPAWHGPGERQDEVPISGASVRDARKIRKGDYAAGLTQRRRPFPSETLARKVKGRRIADVPEGTTVM